MEAIPRGLFLFRRDLRLVDNTGLNAALGACREVLAAFVLDPRQCKGHPYFGVRAHHFMRQSLLELDAELCRRGGRLHVFEGDPTAVVSLLVEQGTIQGVFVNRDYTPFGMAREGAMLAACRRHGLPFGSYDDSLLHAPGDVATSSGGAFQVFGAFHRAARALPLRLPAPLAEGRFVSLELPDLRSVERCSDDDTPSPGGRSHGLALLDRATRLVDYDVHRDRLSLDRTSRLSAHLRFGTVSAREAHDAVSRALGPDHGLLRQLHWRDFFTHVAFHAPKVFGAPYRDNVPRTAWIRCPDLLAVWAKGRTGFPLVDAGMRQLTTTGYMPNRARMVTASFLVKDLHVDWREGERWFARRLVDYDPCVNNGNWQWVAGTGCDASPRYRVFNPWTQQRRFDPGALYIKRWVPELADVPADRIHAIEKSGVPAGVAYPEPMVVHAVEAARTRELYQLKERRCGGPACWL